MFAASPTRRCSATPSGAASIAPCGAGADREALVSPSHGVRWTWKRIRRTGRCARRRLSRARPRARRADRHLVAEPAGMDADAVRRRQGRPDPGHHQSRLPPQRAGIRAAPRSAAPRSSRRPRSRPVNYMEMLNTLLPELATAPSPGELHAARLPELRAVIQIGGPASRHDRVRRGRAHGRRAPPRAARCAGARRCSSTIPSTSSSPAAPRDRPRA